MAHLSFEAKTLSDGVKPLVTNAQCLIRKATIVRPAIETARRVLAVFLFRIAGIMLAGLMLGAVWCPAQQLTNGTLSVTVNAQNGSYQFGPIGSQYVLQASIGAQVDHTWLRQGAIPRIRSLSRHSATRLAPANS